ncbi:cold shock domain-containing protein [Paenibacillus sp. FSL W8-0194]|uniref:cold-shock protein n=1 Tax=Paenibacillus sp. FSL W8-0194 TaxID=2921711 RepID=UPI0030DDBE68
MSYPAAITWQGLKGEEMVEVHSLIGPSLGKSPVAPPKPKREKTKSSRRQGRVKMYLAEKGYGFIRSGKADYFFHASAAEPGLTYLMSGERVTFEVGEDKQGRPIAVKVALAS